MSWGGRKAEVSSSNAGALRRTENCVGMYFTFFRFQPDTATARCPWGGAFKLWSGGSGHKRNAPPEVSGPPATARNDSVCHSYWQ